MPIKPENKALYPPKREWLKIRADILERAGNRCETCGVMNGRYIYRHAEDKAVFIYYIASTDGFTRADGTPIRQSEIPDGFDVGKQPVTVVLTIAHLDNNPSNNDPSNLRALCQYHHLTLDAQHHANNAAKTRAAGQLDLFTNDDQ